MIRRDHCLLKESRAARHCKFPPVERGDGTTRPLIREYVNPNGNVENLLYPQKSSYICYVQTGNHKNRLDFGTNTLTLQRYPFSMVERHRSTSSLASAGSELSDGSTSGRSHHSKKGTRRTLAPPILVYHESARSIVFRDHLRRAAAKEERSSEHANENNNDNNHMQHNQHMRTDHEKRVSKDWTSELNEMTCMFGTRSPSERSDVSEISIEIQGYQPHVAPLPRLELGSNDEFLPLLQSCAGTTGSEWTAAEKEAVSLLEKEQAVVKTIKNDDWTGFLRRFKTPNPPRGRGLDHHNDVGPHTEGNLEYPFNSFVTSTTLLPPGGIKMRAYGNANVYTTGVVFGMPEFPNLDAENAAVDRTDTWCWPSGYSAKTEFNIDSAGNLINGRQEALISLSTIRRYNEDYISKTDYIIGGRLVKGGLHTVPYNEVFVRIGGLGRISDQKDCATGAPRNDLEGTGRSLDKGVGLPIALFVRTATYGHLISMLRTRARLYHVLGAGHIQGIPLLYISPHSGVRVLTERLQKDLLKIASRSLNPFQNPQIAHKTTMDATDPASLATKVEELIELDQSIQKTLTSEECARIAGGFGVTDDSVAKILKDAMIQDKRASKINADAHHLQDIVNEGLASAVRSGDYYTSRQLLILYTLVASEGYKMDLLGEEKIDEGQLEQVSIRKNSLESDAMLLKRHADENDVITLKNSRLPPPPPPPPLDTDRLRSATNSDGLLAVLGAAQVLRAMKDGSAKKRTIESFLAVEE